MIVVADQKRIALVLGGYAGAKVTALQRSLLGASNASSARARAVLAQLRRLNTSAGAAVLASGALLFEGWPERAFAQAGTGAADEDRAAETVKAALGLYALHQQSVASGVALVRAADEEDAAFAARRRGASFGRACRSIEPELESADGVRRRLMSVEAAPDLAGVLHGMRALVRLMKSAQQGSHPIQIDYDMLTQDLYLMQVSEAWRASVFARWACDYFALPSARQA